jgi:hypothetical protein
VDKIVKAPVIIQMNNVLILCHGRAFCVQNPQCGGGINCQTACKPGSVPARRRWMTIHLGRPLPSASRDRPGWRHGSPPEPEGSATPTWSCSRWGLPCRSRCRQRGALLPHHFTLAASPRREAGRGLAVCFCGTFPGVAPAGRYPAPCFHRARTFLPRLAAKAVIRPSGQGIKAGPALSVKRREIPSSASIVESWPVRRTHG